jgi:hypothetical protein
MRRDHEPTTGGADDDTFDGVRIEPIEPIAVIEPGQFTGGNASPAPDWTKRISTRGKLARALIATLAVLVALVLVLPRASFTLPPGIARLLTPVPTQTPQPGRFTAGQLEQVMVPPVPGATSNGLAPSPTDPSTAYMCMSPVSSDPNSGIASGEISLWLTHDAGTSWRRAALPRITGTNCDVTPAPDGSHRVTLSVTDYALDQNAQACAHSSYFLSDDEGATWRSLEHTTLAPAVSTNGSCVLWATARHLFMNTYIYNNGNQGHSILERSDDDGQTWVRADHGLENVNTAWYEQPLDAGGDILGTLVGQFSGGALLSSDLWTTQDAGAHWERIGSVGAGPVSYLVSETDVRNGTQACHCMFGIAYAGFPFAYGQRVFLSRDNIHWTQLPPIPVKGTSAKISGVYNVLDITADGKLLALGADPSTGAAATPDQNGQVNGPPPSLWAWDTSAGQWELAHTHIPCDDLQACFIYSNGVSDAIGANGKAFYTYLWLTIEVGREGGQGAQTYYRLYIPSI